MWGKYICQLSNPGYRYGLSNDFYAAQRFAPLIGCGEVTAAALRPCNHPKLLSAAAQAPVILSRPDERGGLFIREGGEGIAAGGYGAGERAFFTESIRQYLCVVKAD